MTTIRTNTFSTYLKDSNRDQLISNAYDQLEDQFAILQKQYRFKDVEAYCLIADRDRDAFKVYQRMVKRYGIRELNKRYAYV